MAAKNVTIEMIAEEIGMGQRTIRKILRNSETLSAKAPGRGGRWLFTETDKDKVIAIIRAERENATPIDLSDIEV